MKDSAELGEAMNGSAPLRSLSCPYSSADSDQSLGPTRSSSCPNGPGVTLGSEVSGESGASDTSQGRVYYFDTGLTIDDLPDSLNNLVRYTTESADSSTWYAWPTAAQMGRPGLSAVAVTHAHHPINADQLPRPQSSDRSLDDGGLLKARRSGPC